MADRIITMRALLKKHLEDLGSAHDWNHITSQVNPYPIRLSQQWLLSPRDLVNFLFFPFWLGDRLVCSPIRVSNRRRWRSWLARLVRRFSSLPYLHSCLNVD